MTLTLDDKYLITGCVDSSLKLWDLRSGEIISQLRLNSNCTYIKCFRDGDSTNKAFVVAKQNIYIIQINNDNKLEI